MVGATLPSPTEEQQRILEAKGNRVRINARAGTGKTVTMQMLATKLSTEGRKVLYLVYNDRARKEAKNKIPESVAKVSTVHSFALGSVPWSEPLRSKKRNPKWANLEASDLLQDFAPLGSKYQMVAALAADFLRHFLNSKYTKLKDAVGPFTSQLAQLQSVVFTRYADKIIDALQKHMQEWISGEKACPHDFYLKLAYRKGWLTSKLHNYSALLVDEAQDLSPVMMQAIEDFPGRLFVVGDSHQQIYSFRYAVDAMNFLDFNEEYELSLSFRFGNEIATLVSDFIQELKGEKTFRIRGNPKKHSAVQVPDDSLKLITPGTAVLARTNLGLIRTAVQLLNKGVRFTFTKDIKGILHRAKSVYWLSRNQREYIRDRFLRSFESVVELREYAEAMDDRPLLQLIKITEEYGPQTPKLLAQLLVISRNTTSDGVVLSTVHGAKGLEFPEVHLCDDMFGNLSAIMKHDPIEVDKVNEEANIVYVAMTRAQSKLIIPRAAEDLPGNWLSQKLSATSVPSKHEHRVGYSSTTSNTPESVSKRPTKDLSESTKHSVRKLTRDGLGTNHANTYSVGDRVLTANGPGRIVEKRSEKEYLIELDDHPCKLCLSPDMFKGAEQNELS